MKATGVIRRIDDLGRIVIPKEIRRSLKINEGDSLEIYVDTNHIILNKYSVFDNISLISKRIVDSFFGIFNKGIMIKNNNIDAGSRFVDKDISYVYDLERKKCRFLKETFAVSNTRYADVNDITYIEDRSGKTISINQLEISEIVEARLRDILKLAKKQINILTNKEIRYIIVTGGITEIAGFQYLVENVFGYSASTLVINELGVRSNLYSSSLGTIKYFSDKMIARNKDYSMINENNLDIMTKKYLQGWVQFPTGGDTLFKSATRASG